MQMSKRWKKYSTLYVMFPLGKHPYIIKIKVYYWNLNFKIFIKGFGSWCKAWNYSWHNTLNFLLIWVFTCAIYILSIMDKYPTSYVSSSCHSCHFNWYMQMSRSLKKYPTFNFIFTLEKDCFSIKYFKKGYCQHLW